MHVWETLTCMLCAQSQLWARPYDYTQLSQHMAAAVKEANGQDLEPFLHVSPSEQPTPVLDNQVAVKSVAADHKVWAMK